MNKRAGQSPALRSLTRASSVCFNFLTNVINFLSAASVSDCHLGFFQIMNQKKKILQHNAEFL